MNKIFSAIKAEFSVPKVIAFMVMLGVAFTLYAWIKKIPVIGPALDSIKNTVQPSA